MKIAVVSEHASPLDTAGSCAEHSVHVAELATTLVGFGNQVTVFTRRSDRALPAEVDTPAGYRVVHVPARPPSGPPSGHDPMAHLGDVARFLARSWRRCPPDVVHSHYWTSGLVALTAGQPLGLPVVHTNHALGVAERRHLGTADHHRLLAERRIVRQADAIVATSSDEVFELARLGLPRSRVSIVPGGVDSAVFAPDPRRRPTNGRRFRVLTAGPLSLHSGVDDLLTAVAGMPAAELLVAGGPPAAELDRDDDALRLREHADAAGVGRRLKLLGRVGTAELAALMRRSHLLACVPWYEPSGAVALRGMAAGLPVLAVPTGGPADIVVHGVTGEHVPPRRTDELAAALRDLAADPAKRHRYGVAGRERARTRYPLDRLAIDTMRLYQRVRTRDWRDLPAMEVAR